MTPQAVVSSLEVGGSTPADWREGGGGGGYLHASSAARTQPENSVHELNFLFSITA